MLVIVQRLRVEILNIAAASLALTSSFSVAIAVVIVITPFARVPRRVARMEMTIQMNRHVFNSVTFG